MRTGPVADETGIGWTDSTFNPWFGCQAISPGCDHCYAETLTKRTGLVGWGPGEPRRLSSDANWKRPLKWNREAEAAGVRRRVFCASLADVFDNAVPVEWRDRLWVTIRLTPWLDWQLLTKRPQNIKKMLPEDWEEDEHGRWRNGYPNVCLGTTVENREQAATRLPHLIALAAPVRFVSAEPLLESIDLEYIKLPGKGLTLNALTGFYSFDQPCGIQEAAERLSKVPTPISKHVDWVICGGESGHGARPMAPGWERSLRAQCALEGVPYFFKQTGSARGEWPGVTGKGDDPEEWPAEMRVRQFPEVAHA